MAEPFVFYFSPDLEGAPLLMVIADLDVACGLCKHPQIQRFYHATPYHQLTCSVFENLVQNVAQKTGYECENCGEAVGPDHALRGTLTLGFPDEAGLIRGFWARNKPNLYTFVPGKRLDPQELPGFEPPQGGSSTTLSDALVLEMLGRVISVKMAWRALIDDFVASPQGGAELDCADGLTLLLGEDLSDYLHTEDDDHLFIELEEFEDMPAWLGTSRIAALNATGKAGVLISSSAVYDVIERCFEVAQIAYIFDENDQTFRQITSPQKIVFEGELDIEDILYDALFNGMTPGDAGRLAAEEIVGKMLRVWKPSFFEAES